MATPVQQMKIFGKTAGSDLTNKLAVLTNVSIANAFRNIGLWFESIGIGARSFNGEVMVNGALASGTITFSSLANNDTVTVNGVVFTAKTSGATGTAQFNLGANDTAAAANFAAVLETNTSVNTVLSAAAVGAVTTITCEEPGLIGNLCTLAISAHGSVSGANLTGGTDGTIVNLAKGI